MSFLLNRDTCIAWILQNKRVQARFLQYPNDLRIATPTIMGLALWLLRPKSLIRYQVGYGAMMQCAQVLNLDRNIAEKAAILATSSTRPGLRLAPIDWMVVATALETGLTLVTHDMQRYNHVSGLMLVDWMAP